MKIIFTLFFTSFFVQAIGQMVPNYEPYKTMTPSQLYDYRLSIWNTLPAAVGWVNDFEGLFTPTQEDSLERILEHFEKETTIEIAVVTLDSNMVSKERFNEFTYRLLKKWGIGKISKSNGMVICISRDYKTLFISSDFGIDKYMQEYDKAKIISKNIIPYFKKNNYYMGTLAGVNAIIERIMKKRIKRN